MRLALRTWASLEWHFGSAPPRSWGKAQYGPEPRCRSALATWLPTTKVACRLGYGDLGFRLVQKGFMHEFVAICSWVSVEVGVDVRHGHCFEYVETLFYAVVLASASSASNIQRCPNGPPAASQHHIDNYHDIIGHGTGFAELAPGTSNAYHDVHRHTCPF